MQKKKIWSIFKTSAKYQSSQIMKEKALIFISIIKLLKKDLRITNFLLFKREKLKIFIPIRRPIGCEHFRDFKFK